MRRSDERRARLRSARFLLVTRASAAELPAIEAAVRGGVDAVQVRDKSAPSEQLARRVRALRARLGPGVLLVVNDDADAARAGGADGVHVGQADEPPESIRERHGDALLVGLSTHSPEEVAAAQQRPVDWLGFGALFPTSTKEGARVVGPETLSRLPPSRLPIFCIGGIGPDNVTRVVAAGGRRVAVSRAVLEARDPEAAARAIRAVLERAW